MLVGVLVLGHMGMLQTRTDAAYDSEPATGTSARCVDGPMHDEAPGVARKLAQEDSAGGDGARTADPVVRIAETRRCDALREGGVAGAC